MDLPDFDEPFDPDFVSVANTWAKVPEPIRKNVEQHVAAHLPADILAKLRDLHARGMPIDSDPAFFHFGGGMAVRNLCRERLTDDELAACCPFGGDWDNCYIEVLAAIAAAPVGRSQGRVSSPQPRQLQFSFIEPELQYPTQDAVDMYWRVSIGRTTRLLAVPSVLCSAAMVHPRG